ncbi:MAG: hypothetical protein IJJ15_10445 [Ruminococcus sp.]|nr:hypothetical protein [Ruminococcus sp.]
MKNTFAVKVIGTVLAVVMVLSAIMAFAAIGASAATVSPTAQTGSTSHSTVAHTQDGYDWWYPWNWKAPYHPVI